MGFWNRGAIVFSCVCALLLMLALHAEMLDSFFNFLNFAKSILFDYVFTLKGVVFGTVVTVCNLVCISLLLHCVLFRRGPPNPSSTRLGLHLTSPSRVPGTNNEESTKFRASIQGTTGFRI